MCSGVNTHLDGPQGPQHNVLISIPRTASNLVTHLLALPSQPSILAKSRDGYFFLPAISARFKYSTFARPVTYWTFEEKENLERALCQSALAWETWVATAEQDGRGTYVKEHINWMLRPSVESAFLHPDSVSATTSKDTKQAPIAESTQNPTTILDAFWLRLQATFLIRRPALTFPSTLRTAISNEGIETVLGEESEKVMQWECAYQWHVLLYRFLTSLALRSGQVPVIIDASQLQDQDFVKQYAERVVLDPSLVRTSWDAVAEEEQGKLRAVERRMKDTLLASSGIIASKLYSQNIDVEAERKKWKLEFGPTLAQRLERLVHQAMIDYNWLYERRWGQ